MKNYLLFLFITVFLLGRSQSNYQRKLYQSAGTGTLSDVVYSNEYNTTTFVVENYAGSAAYTGYASLTKFTTTTGNVTSSKSFSVAGYDLAIKSVVKNNQMLYMIGNLTNSTNVTTGCVIKYNLSTNSSSWRRMLAVNQTPYSLNSITYDNDKYLYALGSDNISNPTHDLFVLKLDTNGNFVWIKNIGEPTLAQSPANIIYNGKRELYVSTIANLSSAPAPTILRLDSSANVLNSNTIYTLSPSGFSEKFSAMLKGRLVTIDKTTTSLAADPGPFIVRMLDTNLTALITKTLGGVNIKQIYSNNNSLLITGAAPVNSGFPGFRTIRLDSVLTVAGSRYFKKITTSSNLSPASCFINSLNNSFHFFKPNGNDTVTLARADFFEGVGCRDTAYVVTAPAYSYTTAVYAYTTTAITGTLSTFTMPVSTLTYSSTSLCTAITTGINQIARSEIFSFYPNPVNSVLNFTTEKNGIINYKITDIAGKELLSGGAQHSINVSELKAGIYFVALYDENQKLFAIKKFVKE